MLLTDIVKNYVIKPVTLGLVLTTSTGYTEPQRVTPQLMAQEDVSYKSVLKRLLAIIQSMHPEFDDISMLLNEKFDNLVTEEVTPELIEFLGINIKKMTNGRYELWGVVLDKDGKQWYRIKKVY